MSKDTDQYESLQGRMIGENIPSIEDYNKGVEDAIKISQEYREMKSKYPDDSSEYNFTNLIAKLQSLKKKV